MTHQEGLNSVNEKPRQDSTRYDFLIETDQRPISEALFPVKRKHNQTVGDAWHVECCKGLVTDPMATIALSQASRASSSGQRTRDAMEAVSARASRNIQNNGTRKRALLFNLFLTDKQVWMRDKEW